MNVAFWDRVQSIAPRLFDRGDNGQILPPPCGIGCPPGWQPMVLALLSYLNNSEHEIRVEQVKEKFGSLRFYCAGANEYQRAVIAATELLSTITCERTGEPGSLYVNDDGCYKTLSATTAADLGYYKND
jgi:hypothetical protein